MKVIIVGAGKVGYTIASYLAKEDHDITVIDRDASRLEYVGNALDVICVEGSGTDFVLLEDAGIAEAGIIIAATGRDEVNIVCCTAARRIAAEHGNQRLHTVARVRDPQYTRQTERLRKAFGLSDTINPEAEAAREIARILQLPSVSRVDVFSAGGLELVEYRVPAGGKLDGQQLKNLQKNFKCRFLVCAVERDDRVRIPNGDFEIKGGDRISIAASRRELRKLFREAEESWRPVRHVLIVGGGRIGRYLAGRLCDTGIGVTIVEKDQKRCENLCEALPKATILCGDGLRMDMLREAQIQGVDGFATLTGNDEDNIILSMYARTQKAGKVVTKINDEHLLDMLEDTGLDAFVTPKQLVAQQLSQHVRAMENASGSSVETLYRLMDGQVEALEFRAGEKSRCIGITLRELRVKQGILIASILRDEQIRTPDGDTQILPGDKVVVVTTHSGLVDLDGILEA